ncbi:hypothetical protein FA13DRAFT_1713021 [Coprinellus micaceus]|uniref:Uncharacterized protein n=1 Tax=Coprinellus micaceus TaxID=71717 RepID=A0A4Y7SYG1_COPMI|nr:hypothetical protein FA13DRAFT_1713021 [Coprinellus micaceus]
MIPYHQKASAEQTHRSGRLERTARTLLPVKTPFSALEHPPFYCGSPACMTFLYQWVCIIPTWTHKDRGLRIPGKACMTLQMWRSRGFKIELLPAQRSPEGQPDGVCGARNIGVQADARNAHGGCTAAGKSSTAWFAWTGLEAPLRGRLVVSIFCQTSDVASFSVDDSPWSRSKTGTVIGEDTEAQVPASVSKTNLLHVGRRGFNRTVGAALPLLETSSRPNCIRPRPRTWAAEWVSLQLLSAPPLSLALPMGESIEAAFDLPRRDWAGRYKKSLTSTPSKAASQCPCGWTEMENRDPRVPWVHPNKNETGAWGGDSERRWGAPRVRGEGPSQLLIRSARGPDGRSWESKLVRLHWGPPSALRRRRWCGLGGVSIVTTRYWCISTTPSGQNLGSRLAVGNYLSPIASYPKPWKQTAGRRCKQTASRGIAILPPTGSTKTKTHALCTYSTESWSSGNFDS